MEVAASIWRKKKGGFGCGSYHGCGYVQPRPIIVQPRPIKVHPVVIPIPVIYKQPVIHKVPVYKPCGGGCYRPPPPPPCCHPWGK